MNEFDFIFDENRNFNSNEKVKGRFTVTENKREIKLLKRFEELDELLPKNIEKNKTIHLISSDNFGSIELFKCLKKRVDINEVHLTTWSYNSEFINIISELLKEEVSVFFYVDKSIKTRKNHLWAQLVNLKDSNKKLTIKTHHMLHSKVTCIKSNDKFIVVESSANYSNNQRIENFTVTENESLFNFHIKWMSEIISK